MKKKIRNNTRMIRWEIPNRVKKKKKKKSDHAKVLHTESHVKRSLTVDASRRSNGLTFLGSFHWAKGKRESGGPDTTRRNNSRHTHTWTGWHGTNSLFFPDRSFVFWRSGVDGGSIRPLLLEPQHSHTKVACCSFLLQQQLPNTLSLSSCFFLLQKKKKKKKNLILLFPPSYAIEGKRHSSVVGRMDRRVAIN